MEGTGRVLCETGVGIGYAVGAIEDVKEELGHALLLAGTPVKK